LHEEKKMYLRNLFISQKTECAAVLAKKVQESQVSPTFTRKECQAKVYKVSLVKHMFCLWMKTLLH